MKGKDRPLCYYPIFLNISGKRCVVVGGGKVALRKVRMLLEHEARVEVISPELGSELKELARDGKICALNREYQAGDLKGATMAIAATDNGDINLKVLSEAQRKAILVNVVDDPEISDFIVPAYVRRGVITIAVSTSGRSPALARKIRTRLEEEFGEEYAFLVQLIGEVRAELKRQGIRVNGDAWQKAIDLDLLLELLRQGEREKAKTILLNNLKARGE